MSELFVVFKIQGNLLPESTKLKSDLTPGLWGVTTGSGVGGCRRQLTIAIVAREALPAMCAALFNLIRIGGGPGVVR